MNYLNEEIHPNVQQVDQVLDSAQQDQGDRDAKVPIVEGRNDVPVVPPEMINGNIREDSLIFSRDFTTKLNRGI